MVNDVPDCIEALLGGAAGAARRGRECGGVDGLCAHGDGCMELTQPETATERTAVIVHRLTLGETMTIRDIMTVTGLKERGAYALMARVSRVSPLVLDAGKWRFLNIARRVQESVVA